MPHQTELSATISLRTTRIVRVLKQNYIVSAGYHHTYFTVREQRSRMNQDNHSHLSFPQANIISHPHPGGYQQKKVKT